MAPNIDNNEKILLDNPLDPHEKAVLEQIEQEYKLHIFVQSFAQNHNFSVDVEDGQVQSMYAPFSSIPAIHFLREFPQLAALYIDSSRIAKDIR